ncbi:MAG: oxidoreductase [Pseudonocardiales bacterium]|nr:MAG: oxidoreductase [Pseudonocardiales bacterium]
MSRPRSAGLALMAVLLLTGCGAAARAGNPTWVPKPSFVGEGGPPNAPSSPPRPAPNPAPDAPTQSPRPGGPTPSSTKGPDPFVVATELNSPVGLAVLPDGTALVGERTTGRIVRVQPKPGQPVLTVRTLPGLSTAGGGGLLDLALSPNYAQDSLIFAYLSTPTDNRVVTFTLTGPATPVFTAIPRGASSNTGRIVFGSDGLLYIGSGDAGHPGLAGAPNSRAGKVLRVSDIGQPAPGNPDASSPVFTSGHHVVNGLCLVPESNTVIEVEASGSDGPGEVNVLTGGGTYGWPTPSRSSRGPLTTLPASQNGPGGCAVLDDRLFVTSLDGQSLLASTLRANGGALSAGKFTAALTNKYGRLLTVVADPSGGVLWLTTSNRDGYGKPVPADDRVLRIPPPGGGGGADSPA